MRDTLLSWENAGVGEPLLLLHGIGSTRADFTSLRPDLESDFHVLAVDLPGHGESGRIAHVPTVAALADVVEQDLDAQGYGRVHMLGNSLGARIALELAKRGRALSVVAIAPSGMGLPVERLFQGGVMGTARLVLSRIRPLIAPLSHVRAGRGLLLAGLRAQPLATSKDEALAMDTGFAASDDFWRMLWWAVMADLPTGLERIDCPVVLAQGTRDLIASGQTPRYLFAVPGSTFQPLFSAGHAAQGDAPDHTIRLVHEAVDRSLVKRGK